MKKITFLLMALCFCALTNKALGQSWNIGYPTSTDLVAMISGDSFNYSLTISGSGAMKDFVTESAVPWHSIRTNITSIVINTGVTSIGNYAFYNCNNVTGTLSVPNSVTSIGDYAFYKCSSYTQTLSIGNQITAIGNYAFSGCSGITSANIGNAVTTIGNSAFSGCSGITSANIGDAVTTIGNSAFSGCKNINSLTIPNSVISIGENAFSGCMGITSLSLGNSVAYIGENAFIICNGITGTLTIPNSVSYIGNSAFYACGGLTSLIIGNSVASIGENAFAYCSGLASVTNLNINPQNINSNVFYYLNLGSKTLNVPGCALNDYQNATVWSSFGTIIGNEQLPCGTDNIETVETDNISIYPDPVKDELFIKIDYPIGMFEILNLQGKIVIKQYSNGNSINVSSLPRGVYIIQIGDFRGKFIKE
ncbi:MAG: leucine-rich repeat protein [Paludibacter sp.]|nr:leucine-rich repeat protein [Paludibacter sp.]